MKLLCLSILSLSIFSCDSIKPVDEDDPFAKRFLGKNYCTKAPLFIWEFPEGHRKHFDILGVLVLRPIDGEETLEQHRKNMSKRMSLSSVKTPSFHLVEEGSKITIDKIVYRDASIYIGAASSYQVLVKVNDALYQGKRYINARGLFDGSLIKGNSDQISSQYLEPC